MARGKYILVTGVIAALAMANPVRQAQAATAVVRAVGDARAWSIMPGDSRVLTWRWSEGATEATLFASNLATCASAVSAAVVRDAAIDASCEIPLAGNGIFDVTLRETAGETTIYSKTVRLKVGPAADTVALDKNDASFRTFDEPRIYSWDAAWFAPSPQTASLTTAQKGGSALGAWTLPSLSGFDVLRSDTHFARRTGRMVASLELDGVVAATANLSIPSGAMIIFR